MEVQLTPDQQALVSGRLHRPEEAMQQALLLWEERERRHVLLDYLNVGRRAADHQVRQKCSQIR